MHSVYDRESERTKISLRRDISLQVRHIPLPHFAENLGRTWGRCSGGSIEPLYIKNLYKYKINTSTS